MPLPRCALAAAALLSLAGCGGPSSPPPSPPQDTAALERTEVRKDFIILRELAKQHAIQTKSANEARLAAVERHLRERLETLPDTGQSAEEREILRNARALLAE